jgi:hypothetical protein
MGWVLVLSVSFQDQEVAMRSRLSERAILAGLGLCLLLIGGVVAGRLARPAAVAAQPGAARAARTTLAARDGNKWFECQLVNVAAYTHRIHVMCNPADGSIAYFAQANDPAHATAANEMLAIANTALALGRSIDVLYDPSDLDTPPGCLVTDCRTLLAVSMGTP